MAWIKFQDVDGISADFTPSSGIWIHNRGTTNITLRSTNSSSAQVTTMTLAAGAVFTANDPTGLQLITVDATGGEASVGCN